MFVCLAAPLMALTLYISLSECRKLSVNNFFTTFSRITDMKSVTVKAEAAYMD